MSLMLSLNITKPYNISDGPMGRALSPGSATIAIIMKGGTFPFRDVETRLMFWQSSSIWHFALEVMINEQITEIQKFYKPVSSLWNPQ